MNTEADLLNSLEDAQGRNPIEFQFGFFLEDSCDDSAVGIQVILLCYIVTGTSHQ
jgi:hypothetical protein